MGGDRAVEFLRDNTRVWFLSERDGWMHLYTLDVTADGAKPTQLTSGKWEITAAELSRDGRRFYITSTEVHPGERQLYTHADRRRRADEAHVDDGIERGGDLARRLDAGARLLVQQQASRGVHRAEPSGRAGHAGHVHADGRVAVVQLDRSAR